MSEQKDGSNPAFSNVGDGARYDGMTLRDYFAGQALAGLMTGSVAYPQDDNPLQQVAGWAYVAADAMLAERAKEIGDE